MGFADALLRSAIGTGANQLNRQNNPSGGFGAFIAKARGSSEQKNQPEYGGTNGVEVPVHPPVNQPQYIPSENSQQNSSNSFGSSETSKANETKETKKDKDTRKDKDTQKKGGKGFANMLATLASPLASASVNKPETVPLAMAGLPVVAAANAMPSVSFRESGGMMVPVVNNAGNLEQAGYEADPYAIMNTEELVSPKKASEKKNGSGDDSMNDVLRSDSGLYLADNWQPKTQMDQYYEWLDTEDGQKFLETYGEQFNKDNQGYTNLRASMNRDAWADVMGYGNGEGINGWQDLYANSGVDLSDENAMDNMMEYLYGTGAIDLDASLRNEGWLNDKVGQDLDAYDEAALWYALQNPDLVASLNESYGTEEEQLDANDVAYLALASRLGNMGYGTNFLGDLNAAAQAAGQTDVFGMTDDKQLGVLGEDGKYYVPEERNKPRQGGYRMDESLMLNPYQGSPDAYMVDTLLAAYNAGLLNEESTSESSK